MPRRTHNHKKQAEAAKTGVTGVSGVSPKAPIDAKLTYAAMMLSYAFEYGVDFKNRVITLSGKVAKPWFDVIDAALNQMESESRATVTIRIHSPGGDTYEAMALIGRIQQSKCHIVTEGYGHVQSCAALILACGDKRRLHKYAQFMWHEVTYALEEGKHSEHSNTVKQFDREEDLWAEAMAEMSKKDASFWRKEGVHLDSYIDSAKLLEYGVVDEVF